MKDLFERQIKSEIQSQKSRAEDSGFAGHCKSMCQKCVRNADPDMDPDMETVKCQAELAAGLVPGKVKSDPAVLGQMPCTKSYWKRPGSPVKTRMAVTGRIGHGRAGDEEPDAA